MRDVLWPYTRGPPACEATPQPRTAPAPASSHGTHAPSPQASSGRVPDAPSSSARAGAVSEAPLASTPPSSAPPTPPSAPDDAGAASPTPASASAVAVGSVACSPLVTAVLFRSRSSTPTPGASPPGASSDMAAATTQLYRVPAKVAFSDDVSSAEEGHSWPLRRDGRACRLGRCVQRPGGQGAHGHPVRVLQQRG